MSAGSVHSCTMHHIGVVDCGRMVEFGVIGCGRQLGKVAMETLERRAPCVATQVRAAPAILRLQRDVVAARLQFSQHAAQEMRVAVVPVGDQRVGVENEPHAALLTRPRVACVAQRRGIGLRTCSTCRSRREPAGALACAGGEAAAQRRLPASRSNAAAKPAASSAARTVPRHATARGTSGCRTRTSAAPCTRRLQHRETERLVDARRCKDRGARRMSAQRRARQFARRIGMLAARTVAPSGRSSAPAMTTGQRERQAAASSVAAFLPSSHQRRPPARTARRHWRRVRLPWHSRPYATSSAAVDTSLVASNGCASAQAPTSARRSPRAGQRPCHCQSSGSGSPRTASHQVRDAGMRCDDHGHVAGMDAACEGTFK